MEKNRPFPFTDRCPFIEVIIMSRIIFHIDMNSFFASCEQALNPELKKRPLIVGGDPETRRGIVLAASYDAKAKGVYTTQLVKDAMRMCPEALIIKSTHGLYSDMSKKVMAIFDDFTPLKQQASIDEAYLDMTGTEHLFGDYMTCAETIQKRILDELDLPCSVGIAHNKLLAKMGSDYKKPMGITRIFEEDIPTKLWPLKVGDLHGIGKKTVPKLNDMGIMTIGDLAAYDQDLLIALFGYKGGISMHNKAKGMASDDVRNTHEPAKSVGNERTYSSDISDFERIKEEVLLLADKVGFRLRKHMLSGRTVTVKLKYSDFKVNTRGKTLQAPTHHTDLIYETAVELLKEGWNGKPLRLIGVTVSNFDDEEDQQISLFDMEEAANPEHSEVGHRLDEIRQRFGYGMIKRATLMDKKPPKG